MSEPQLQELRRHLCGSMTDGEAASLLRTIDVQLDFSRDVINYGGSATGIKKRMADEVDRYREIRACVVRLRVALGRLDLAGNSMIDKGSSYDVVLQQIFDDAKFRENQFDSSLFNDKSSKGRPRAEWRDQLIRLTWENYPARLAKKTAGGHFEATIKILISYLNEDVNDLHSVVLKSLRTV